MGFFKSSREELIRQQAKVFFDRQLFRLVVQMVDRGERMAAKNKPEAAVLDSLEPGDRRVGIIREDEWGAVIEERPDKHFVSSQQAFFVHSE